MEIRHIVGLSTKNKSYRFAVRKKDGNFENVKTAFLLNLIKTL